jgi:UDP-N-acetylmuramate--L-alanine ligase
MNWNEIKKIYFVGIGGIGMSAAAGIAAAKGFEVSGSDAHDVYEPSKGILDYFKIKYAIGYDEGNIPSGDESPDLVVATAAVDESNPEMAKFKSLGIRIISYPELLGFLTEDKKRIVVVGTHGKGTTSGALAYVLKKLNDSSFFVGGVLNNLQTNFFYGPGPYFVLEGDEYKSSAENMRPKFSYYNPDVLLINNIEFDHPDIYPDLESFKKPFRELVEKMSAESFIVYNADDENVLDVIQNSKAKKIGFGFKKGDVLGKSRRLSEENRMFHIEVASPKGDFEITTTFPGELYAYDMLAASTVLKHLFHQNDEEFKKAISLLPEYKGIKRRYEIISESNPVIIDDYAHHPSAVRQTLEATREKYPDQRIICFFEPHTYSRTKETLKELENAFGSAGIVFIAEVYPAREQKLPSSITGQEVVDKIKEHHDEVYLVKDRADAMEKYKAIAKSDDVIVVMAVGSFNTLVYDLKN